MTQPELLLSLYSFGQSVNVKFISSEKYFMYIFITNVPAALQTSTDRERCHHIVFLKNKQILNSELMQITFLSILTLEYNQSITVRKNT